MRKVKPGESLVIPAETFNTFIDAAQDFRRRQTAIARKPHTEQHRSDIILVKNASGADRDRFHVVGLGEPLITPDYNEPEFQNRLALEGVSPTEADYAGRFAVLLKPLKADAIGIAVVTGVTVATVDVQDEAHAFADVNDGQPATQKSAAVGSAQILWKEAGTGRRLGRGPPARRSHGITRQPEDPLRHWRHGRHRDVGQREPGH